MPSVCLTPSFQLRKPPPGTKGTGDFVPICGEALTRPSWQEGRSPCAGIRHRTAREWGSVGNPAPSARRKPGPSVPTVPVSGEKCPSCHVFTRGFRTVRTDAPAFPRSRRPHLPTLPLFRARGQGAGTKSPVPFVPGFRVRKVTHGTPARPRLRASPYNIGVHTLDRRTIWLFERKTSRASPTTRASP